MNQLNYPGQLSSSMVESAFRISVTGVGLGKIPPPPTKKDATQRQRLYRDLRSFLVSLPEHSPHSPAPPPKFNHPPGPDPSLEPGCFDDSRPDPGLALALVIGARNYSLAPAALEPMVHPVGPAPPAHRLPAGPVPAHLG